MPAILTAAGNCSTDARMTGHPGTSNAHFMGEPGPADCVLRCPAHLALEAVGDHVEVVGGLLAVLPRVGDAVELVGDQVLALLNAQLQLRQPFPVLSL